MRLGGSHSYIAYIPYIIRSRSTAWEAFQLANWLDSAGFGFFLPGWKAEQEAERREQVLRNLWGA